MVEQKKNNDTPQRTMFDESNRLFLDDRQGFRLKAHCQRCQRRETYTTDALRERLGNCQIRGLQTTIARLWQCPRLFQPSGWECQITVELAGQINKNYSSDRPHIPEALRTFRAAPVRDSLQLGELAEWSILFGVCGCGHAGAINHIALIRRFGASARLSEIAPFLRCRRNPDHRNLIFALGQLSR